MIYCIILGMFVIPLLLTAWVAPKALRAERQYIVGMIKEVYPDCDIWS